MQPRLFVTIALLAACVGDDGGDDVGFEVEEGIEELAPGPQLGKEDSAGVPGLPVTGDYAATQAWTVANQWEDTDTAEARKAGLAWGEDSGLSWDEKYARWVASFEQQQSFDSWFKTIAISTPFGKSVPGPKIDCADLTLLLRLSFAAWYRLPIYFVGYDGNTVVYFGHFGVRTATGRWASAPAFGTAYRDYSNLPPAQYEASWPKDTALRTRGVAQNDGLPFLGEGARLGAFLDEIHLNKRAARLVFFAQAYLGSHNMADGRNTYNLVPEAVKPGDVLVFRRSPRVEGHATIVTRVTPVGDTNMKLDSVYGNIPVAQPMWQDPAQSRLLFTSPEGGGPVLNTPYGGTALYSHLNGGLKRVRVAKAQGGRWVNTWMTADRPSWINDTDYDKIGARPARFAELLGDPDPAVVRDQLVQVIEAKRMHLREHPASCAARAAREEAFRQLYEHMAAAYGMNRAAVDAQFRTTIEDYIYAPLDYSRSRTCCWNSTTAAMHQLIVDYQKSAAANGCVAPTVFKLTANSYDPFASFAASAGRAADWLPWTEDEACAAAGATDDVVIPAPELTPWCSLPAAMP